MEKPTSLSFKAELKDAFEGLQNVAPNPFDKVLTAAQIAEEFSRKWQVLVAPVPLLARDYCDRIKDELLLMGFAANTRICRNEISVTYSREGSEHLRIALAVFKDAVEAVTEDKGYIWPVMIAGEINMRVGAVTQGASLPPQTIAALMRVHGYAKMEKRVNGRRKWVYCKQ